MMDPFATDQRNHPAGSYAGPTIETDRLRVCLSPFGARVCDVSFRSEDGAETPVAIAFADDGAYARQDTYVGAICGRYANRIAGSGYIDPQGHHIRLTANEGLNHLHGGTAGFDRMTWHVSEKSSDLVRFSLSSPDGAEGYPGNLEAEAIYSVIQSNRLRLELRATCDKLCPVSLTSHIYWNLSGRFNESAADHMLRIDADSYLPVDKYLIPLKGRSSVAETGFDFRSSTRIADRIAAIGGVLDHNFCLNGKPGQLRQTAELSDPGSGRKLKFFSMEPGLQVYLANHFSDGLVTANGMRLHRCGGVTLEPQAFPNSPNRPDFPSPWLSPGKVYGHIMEWEFT